MPEPFTHTAEVGTDDKCGICGYDVEVKVIHIWPPRKTKQSDIYELREENERYRRVLHGIRESCVELGLRRYVQIITNVLGDDAGQPSGA